MERGGVEWRVVNEGGNVPLLILTPLVPRIGVVSPLVSHP